MSELDLKGTIAETLKEIKTREPEETQEEDKVPDPVEPEVAEDVEESDEPEPEEQEQPVEAKKPDTEPKEKSEPPKEVDKSLINPPSTWTAKGKSLWSSLPEDARKEIRKREADAMKGIEQYKERAQFGERIERTVTPYKAFLNAKGTTAEQAVQDALNLAYALDTSNPQQKGLILKRIAQQYGADLKVLTEQPNPEQERLNQLLSPLQQEIEALKRERQNSLLQTQQQQNESLAKTIEDFANATDETGKLKHPYFEDVKGFMASILESDRAKTLDEAYQLACKADPEISKYVTPQVTTQKIAADAKARAAKAQANNKIAPSKKPVPAGTPSVGSMSDTIRRKLTEIRAT